VLLLSPSFLTICSGDNLEKLKRSVMDKIAEAESEEMDVEVEIRRLTERKLALISRRLRLRKEANLLTSKEKILFEKELASIEEVEKLEAEAAKASASSGSSSVPSGSSAPCAQADDLASFGLAVSPVPSEFLGLDLPDDWSYSQFLDTGGTA
jgi:hypothetical protein